MKRRVIGILAFVMITLLAFAVACGSTDSDDELTEEKKYDYIQLPPEMTSWSEEKDDGTSVSDALVIRDNQPYRLTQEEYHRIMDGNESIDEVLADRENWAAQWKDYVLPATVYPEGMMIEQKGVENDDLTTFFPFIVCWTPYYYKYGCNTTY